MAALKALVLAGVAVCGLAHASLAADLPPAPPLEPLEEAGAPQFNGWYLRGDVGMAAQPTTPDLVYSPNPLAGGYFSSAAYQGFSNTSISASGLVDIGVGYQVNPWFRGDITLEYRDGGNFQSLYTLNDPTNKVQYADFYRTNTSSFIGMLNGYANLGTWYGLSPFVGTGIGWAHNTLYGMTDQGLATIAHYASVPAGGYFSNGSTSNLAWALMAGLDFNVTENLKLEIGYRYLNMGKIGSGASNCLNGAGIGGPFSSSNCGGTHNTIASSNTLASNDFRIGMIWMIGETPPPVLTRKY
jgi:opacity protein-like surface antigen